MHFSGEKLRRSVMSCRASKHSPGISSTHWEYFLTGFVTNLLLFAVLSLAATKSYGSCLLWILVAKSIFTLGIQRIQAQNVNEF